MTPSAATWMLSPESCVPVIAKSLSHGAASSPHGGAGQVPWAVTHVAETGSTNADLAQRAGRGARHGAVLVADVQHQGRGRMGRSWQAPPGTALLFSALLRLPDIPVTRRGWVGAALGLAIADAVRDMFGLNAALKWPNDVLIDGRKVAGILSELAGDAVVVGAGINVSVSASELPRADATSLVLSGADPALCDRDALLDAILGRLGAVLAPWQAVAGDVDACGLRAEYLRRCATVGAAVTVDLPDGTAVTGRAVDVAQDGSIVINDGRSDRRFAAGDVHHLRSDASQQVGRPSRNVDTALRRP
jgi:BirA family biotin operon repressor/biotin-[acetyl-CoA-carboxylase] ligase